MVTPAGTVIVAAADYKYTTTIEEIMVRIEFEKMYGDIVFRDAITLLDDHTLTESDIEAIQQERFDNWVAVITAPPPDPAPEDIVDVTAEVVPDAVAE
jgi:hypothetical protein